MNLKKIKDKLLHVKTDIDKDSPQYIRLRLILLYLYMSIFFLLIFVFIYLLLGNYTRVAIMLASSIYLRIGGIYRIKRTGNLNSTGTISVIFMFILSVYLLLTGGISNTGIFWMFSFPGMILFLKGLKSRVYWLISYFILIGTTGYFVVNTGFDSPYSSTERIIFMGSLFFLSLILLIYEKIVSDFTTTITDQKTTLIKEVGLRNKYEKELRQTLVNVEYKNEQLNEAKGKFKELYEITEKDRNELGTILESIGDGVIVLDKDRRINLANPVAAGLSGYTTNELKGSLFGEKLKFINEKDKSSVFEFLDKVYSTGEVVELPKNISLVRKDKTEVSVGDSAAPINIGEDNETVGAVIVFRDISKEREIDQMKTEFVSLASHQLKTPLTSSKYILELIFDGSLGELDPTIKSQVIELGKINEKMISLVNDLLNISRIETGKRFNIEKRKIDVRIMWHKAIEELKPIFESKNVYIDFKDSGEILVNVDEKKVGEVFKNLLSNAIKYSHNDSKVEISFNQEKDTHLTVVVKDFGIGIPDSQKDQIFTKMFRAQNATDSEEEGTGLGLYIAKAIIEKSGGNIYFQSIQNEGTTFFLELPYE